MVELEVASRTSPQAAKPFWTSMTARRPAQQAKHESRNIARKKHRRLSRVSITVVFIYVRHRQSKFLHDKAFSTNHITFNLLIVNYSKIGRQNSLKYEEEKKQKC